MSTRARWGKTPQKSHEPTQDEVGGDNDHDNNNNNNPENEHINDGQQKPNASSAAADSSSKEKPTAEEVLDSAIEVRKSSINATTRILRDLETAKNIEIEALEMLHKDLERARRMDDTLIGIDESVSRSRKYITALGRKLYRDGCVKIMCTLLICAIIVIAVMLAMEGFDKIGGASNNGGSSTTVVIQNTGDAETTTAAPPPASSSLRKSTMTKKK